MNNEQILKKAIEKAVKNGWKPRQSWLDDARKNIDNVIVELVIFNHDFAKAFWGEKEITIEVNAFNRNLDYKEPAWQYHLKQIVLEEDPIKYLEQFL